MQLDVWDDRAVNPKMESSAVSTFRPRRGLDAIVAFLSEPASYPTAPTTVEVVETHMSFVFLAGDFVYKMKKPVRLPFLDYRDLEARRRSCEREMALNQRLAPGIYLGVIPLLRDPHGDLLLTGNGAPVEWLVVMRRLDREGLLDRVVARGEASEAGVARLCRVLAKFYRESAPIEIAPSEVISWWHRDIDRVAASLANSRLALPPTSYAGPVAALRHFLEEDSALIAARVTAGRIVDGHGDLRPEHVQLGPPTLVIDRLEFDERLRRVDPFDEAVFLGLECEKLGSAWIGPRLIEGLTRRLRDTPPPALLRFYRTFRCCLRAQLSIEHLLDPKPRTPERWQPQAIDYLRLALP